MSLNWLPRFFRKKQFGQQRQGQQPRQRKQRVRLGVESLELRELLSTMTAFTPDAVLAASQTLPQVEPLGSPSDVGYSPSQIRHAYGFDQLSLTGAGQAIAIVDAYNDPNILSDLDIFDQNYSWNSSKGSPSLFEQYGAASSFLTIYNQDGHVINPTNTNIPTDQGSGVPGQTGYIPPGLWEMEESLDVEWAHAIAPGAKIDLIECENNSYNLYKGVLSAASLPGVSVVSMSWGNNTNSDEKSKDLDSFFTVPAGHTPVTFVASTGDLHQPSYPATSVNVLAVGGTVLAASSDGTYLGETYWASGPYGGGWGPDTNEHEPAYQNKVQDTTARTVPDVAYNAGASVAVYDSYATGSNPQFGENGTSAGAPQWAALIALADQGRVSEGLTVLDGRSQTLPLLYHMPSSAFHQVPSQYNLGLTGPGYDPATGLGTPIANQVVAALDQPFTMVGTTLYQFQQGTLWQYTPYVGWTQDTGVVSFAVANNIVYALHSNGYLLKDRGFGWEDSASGVQDISVASDGTLYALHTNRYLLKTQGAGWSDVGRCSSFNTLPGKVTSIAIEGGVLYYLTPSDELFKNGIMTTSGVVSFAVANNAVYALHSNDYLLKDRGFGWEDSASGVQEIIVAGDGTLYALHTNGYLLKDRGFGWEDSASGVREVVVVGDGTLYALHTNGYLLKTQGAGWFDVDNRVYAIVVGSDGSLLKIKLL